LECYAGYHSPDQALAERLMAALERKDAGAQVFFAPSSLRAGGFWSKALAEGIAQADAFILLVGERGVGNWQVLEYDEALDRRVSSPGFPVILVLLEGQTAPGLPFLRRLHWIISSDPSSEKDVARLFDAASGSSTRPSELWRYTSPYRGLAAMEEKDSDYFFGRERETVDVLTALAASGDRLPVLLGNSGVGKSSLAQAGVLAALKRQAWPDGLEKPPEWPHAFADSRRWCFLTLKPGTEPLKALVETFLDTWQLGAIDPERVKQQNGWIELLRDGKAMLRDLLDATERRYKELDRAQPPAFLLYVDQGEELYVRAEEQQRRRFSEVIAQGTGDPRLYMLMSMRTDFLGELQKDEPLFKVHCKIDVPPLREAELRAVVSRPAELLSARFETDGLVEIITRRTAEDSVKDAGALPLLSYTLDDMWTQMVKRGDGVLRLPAQSFELGGVLSERADAFLAKHPNSEDALRRILTLKLATVREGEEPTRRRALRSEFTDEEWRLVSELADHPNRLLVTATPESGETYAEVAHEAIFRRWNKLRNWIAVEREFLAWRTGLEAARRAWEGTPKRFKREALLMGAALILAQSWLKRRSKDIPAVDRAFTLRSRRQKIDKRVRIGVVMFVIFLLLLVPVLSDVWVRMQYQTRQEMDYALRDRANIALEKLVATIEADEVKAEGKPGKATASALGQFSWYQLYRFEPEKALAAADRALSLVPGVLWIEASRAHALMFLNRREEALDLYLAHKDKPIAPNDDKSWQKAIAEDFEGFRKAGFHYSYGFLMDKIEKMLDVNREK
jgi:Novel STAND NTPase 1/TIR domain